MDLQIAKGETVVLLVDPRDTRDKGWILSSDVSDVIFTVRETEEGEALLQLHGVVEKIGESVDDPGKVAVLLYSKDTKDIPVGDYYYDVTLYKTGHWFDINEYSGLYCKIDYGKVKDSDDEWLEVEEGWLELTDDTTNYVQVTQSGEYLVTTGDYDSDSNGYLYYPLYRIVTSSGEIIDTMPYTGWFTEGAHSGLDFDYGAGYVLDSNNELQSVSSGTITLKPSITNYIEVTEAGVVASNITRFTSGRYPLFTATTDASDVTDVTRQDNSLILDDRDIYVRGDSYTQSVKAALTVIWTPTQAED